MGDFVIFASVLRSLRQGFPDARITLVLCDWIRPIAELCPYVDEVIPFASRGPRWWQFILGPYRALRIAMKLRGPFDLAVNPRFDRDIRGAAFLAEFSLAPWVVGYPSSTESFKAVANRGYDRLYTHLFPDSGERDFSLSGIHELERSRALLTLLGIPAHDLRPELWISPNDRQEADAILRRNGWHAGDTLICLGINASYARKRWPMSFFLQLARGLEALPGARFLIVGSHRERQSAELLRPVLGSRLINLSGQTPLRLSAAALAECRLYVGNDSGPKHLAAALGKPIIEINCHPQDGDPTHFQSPERFGAITESVILLSPRTALAPCTSACFAAEPHCIGQISPEEVLSAVCEMIRKTSPAGISALAIGHE
jgi:ADP-heptose:LPS heptosyltransferase